MDEDLKKLHFDQGKARQAMLDLNERVEKEKRTFTAEEDETFNKAYAEFERCKTRLNEIKEDGRKTQLREVRMQQVEDDFKAIERETRALISTPGTGIAVLTPGDKGATTEDLTPAEREQRIFEAKEKEYRAIFNQLLSNELKIASMNPEQRSLIKGSPTQGGYMVAPLKMIQGLIKDVDNETFMRQLCRHLPSLKKVVALGVLTLTQKMAAASWTGELTVASEDNNLRVGRRVFAPNPFSAFVKISQDLLMNASSVDPETIVRGELARIIGELQEQAYLYGDGVNKPLGLLTQHADGVPASRYISTGMGSTDIAFDGIIEAKFNLKPQYRRSKALRMLVHSDFIKRALKLKDLEGRYIWQQSVIPGEPDTILNIKLVESLWMPNTFTTGLTVGVIGDFDWYWIADVEQLDIVVLQELFAMTNEVGYKARGFTEGQPVKAEAFSVMKLA